MDFESPDNAKEFPGLYLEPNQESHSGSDSDEKLNRKELLIGKRKDKKESKKDKGYVAFEGESSEEEMEESKSPSKTKKSKTAFKFPGSKKDKSKDKPKEVKEPKKEKDLKEKKELKDVKKETKEVKKDSKEVKKDSKEVKKDSKEVKKDSKEVKKDSKDGKEKAKLKRKEKLKSKLTEDGEERSIFGVSLQVAVERNKCHDGIELPVIVRECIDYIEEHGLSCEGIYRLSGVKSKVQQIKRQYDNNEKVYLHEYEPHIVASVLKLFMRELPEPILTNSLNSHFEDACSNKSDNARESKLIDLIARLPTPNRLLLSWIFVHMGHVIAREDKNKMSLQNVAIVLSPTIQISHRVLNSFFTHSKVLFKDIEIKKYVPPIRPETSRLSMELPNTPTAIEEELRKQESLLNQLHAELITGVKNSIKEDEIWEVQRIVTQLKRTLRFSKQRSENNGASSQDKKMPTSMEEDMIDTRLQQVDDEHDESAKEEKVDELPVPVKETDKDGNELETVRDDSALSTTINEAPSESVDKDESEKETSGMSCDHSSNDNVMNSEHADPKLSHSNEIDDIKNAEEEKDEIIDTELLRLLEEEKEARLEYNELKSLGEDLKKKIESERSEAERLQVEINALEKIYRYRQVSFDSEDISSDSSVSSDSDDEDKLIGILDYVTKQNDEHRYKNNELIAQIEQERKSCSSIKVQIRIIHDSTNNSITVN